MNSQTSSVYLFFRPFIKWLYHILTHTTEIERVARRHDLNALCTFRKYLEFSLDHSKVLANFTVNHCKWDEPFNQEFVK